MKNKIWTYIVILTAILTLSGRCLASEKPQVRSQLDELKVHANNLRVQRRWNECAEAYSRAMKMDLNGKDWTLFYFRGICYDRAGQWPKAEGDFNRALAIVPDQPNVLNYLGYSWVDRGVNISKALSMLRRAAQLRPTDGNTMDSLGWAYFKVGNNDRAIEFLKRAVDLLPRDPLIRDHLGDAYLKAGNVAGARAQWERARSLQPDPKDLNRIVKKLETTPMSAGPDGAASQTVEVSANVGHTQFIRAASFSKSERFLATAGWDDTVRIWELKSGRLLKTIDATAVNELAFADNDQKLFVDGDVNSTVKAYSLGAANKSGFALCAGGRHSISADGAYVACLGDNGHAEIVDTETGKAVAARDLRNCSYFEFLGRTHNMVLVAADATVRIWSINKPDLTIGATLEGYHSDSIFSQRQSPDGSTLAILSKDRSLKLIDIETGKLMTAVALNEYLPQVKYLDIQLHAADLRFSNDGKKLLISSIYDSRANSSELLLANLSAPSPLLSKIHFRDKAITTFFSRDSTHLYAVGMVGTLSKYDIASRAETRLFGVAIWHQSNKLTFPELKDPSIVKFVQSRTPGSYADDLSRISKQKNAFVSKLRAKFAADEIDAEANSPDGSIVWMIRKPGYLTVWDTSSEKELGTKKVQLTSSYILPVVSSKGAWIAYLAQESEKTAGLWNPRTGREVKIPYQLKKLDTFGFSADEMTVALAGRDDGEERIELFDLKTGHKLRDVVSDHDNPGGTNFVMWMWLSADHTLAAIHRSESRWELENLRSGETNPLQRSPWLARNFEFSRDGKFAISRAPVFQVWDVATGKLLVSSLSFKSGDWVTITPEGFFDASPGGAKLLTVVRGLKAYSIDQVYQALYRPDLVREALAGDPDGKVKAAAARLDLNKVMASGAAPQVRIVSPGAGAENETDEVKIKAAITDEGGGVGKIEWRVNGVTLGVETRGLGRIEAKPSVKERQVERTLSLEPGENKIEVVAYNAKNLIASDPAAVTVKWNGQKTAKPPKLYVLAVGVNDYYDSRLKLAYAAPDAEALAVALKKAGAGLYGGVEVKTVLDDKVTAANLDRVFGELSKEITPRDVFVFFLAGHGKTEQGRYYFIPYDFKYQDETSIEKEGLDQDRFQAWFSRIPARKSILLYDTCESGSLTGDKRRGSDIDERLGALERLTRATGRTFLTATTDDAPALEGYHGHGVFTYSLLSALDGADSNKDGLIEVTELIGYVDRAVPDLSFKAFKLRQIPQAKMFGSDFSLASKVAVLPASDNPGGPSIPTKATHVVIAKAAVYKAESKTAPLITTLDPGTLVALVKTDAGWALVAKDGVGLGYVEKKELVRLQ